MITEHVAYTNSEIGKEILDDFREYLPKFKKIIPTITREMSTDFQMEEKGLSAEQAKIEAFYMIKKEDRRQEMGKPTGFLDYERKENRERAPLERIKHFNEFHTPLSKEEQEKQGARCMDCGVPFCQSGMLIKGMASGCPLNNLDARVE